MNSNATYRIVLDTRRPIQSGSYPVKLRLTFRRKPKYYKTKYYLTEEDFQKAYENKKQPNDATLRRLRLKFRDIESKVESIIQDLDDFNFQKFESIYLKQKEDIHAKDLDYYFTQITGDNSLSLSTRELAQNSYMAIQKGLGLTTLKGVELSSISVIKLKQIEAHLLEQGRTETTVSIYMRNLRKIFNQAIKDGLIDPKQYPFGKSQYLPPKVRRRKMPLKRDDLKRLMNFDAGSNKFLQEAKDFFLLSLFLEGVNMTDILLLKNINLKSGHIRFYRRKTRTTSSTMSEHATLIVPEAEKIIAQYRQTESNNDEAYVFKILKNGMSEVEKRTAIKNFTRKINQHLQGVAKICGIDVKLTTVVARHTWISYASTIFGAEETRRRIGHKDLKSTEHYIASLTGRDEVINFREIINESN